MPDIFAVIADATRRDLLRLLLECRKASDAGESSVGELVDRLGLSQPTVSKHLKVLRESHLVTVREDGQHRYYSLRAGDLNPTEIDAVAAWVRPFLSGDRGNGSDQEATPALPVTTGSRQVLRLASATGRSLGRSIASLINAARVGGSEFCDVVGDLVVAITPVVVPSADATNARRRRLGRH